MGDLAYAPPMQILIHELIQPVLRFGGGFELIKDGKDNTGYWKLIEGTIMWVTFTLTLTYSKAADALPLTLPGTYVATPVLCNTSDISAPTYSGSVLST